MLPRQRAFNKRKQHSSRGGKYDNGISPSKMKKKLVKMDGDSKGYGKYSKGIGKGNYSRVNSGDGQDRGRHKGNNRSNGDKRKKSMDKKNSKGNLGRKKKSKSSLSQNKKSRGASKNKSKNKSKQEGYYKVRKSNSKHPTGMNRNQSNKIEVENPHDNNQYPPRNFSRREEQGLPEHREMIPRHFNMHPQREVMSRGKHQMGVDDMRRFREGLNESDMSDQIQNNTRDYYDQEHPYNNPEAAQRPKGKKIVIYCSINLKEN